MDDRTRLFLTAPPARLLVRMATPNSLAFMIQSTVSIGEVWIIGQLGVSALASIALAFPLLMLTQAMSGGALGGAVTSSIARALGKGDREGAGRLIWHALALALAGSTLFLGLFLAAGESLLRFLGGSGDILASAMEYCTILFFGGVFLWAMGAVGAVFRGMGDMHTPALLMVLGVFIQVPLTAILVLGLFGAPQLGIAGAAISAVVSGFVISGIMLAMLAGKGRVISIERSAMVFEKRLFADIFKVAAPASLSPILTILIILSLTAMIARFGEAALAGYGIGSRIEFLLIPLVFGIGAAMTSLVGLSVGAGDIDRAERIGWTGGAMAAALAGVLGLLLWLFPDQWIGAFTQDPQAFAAAKSYVQIVGPFYAFQGLGLSLYFASQGAGYMKWPVVVTILRVVLALGGSWLLAFQLGWGLEGIYIAAAVAMAMFGLTMAGSVKLGAWRE